MVDNLAKTLHDVEKMIKDLDTEHGYIVGRNGEIINHTIGNESGVTPPQEMITNNIFTHNHPSGVCSFSPQDIKSIITCNGYGIRTVTSNGQYVGLTRLGDFWDTNLLEELRKSGIDKSKLGIISDRIARQKYGEKATIIQKSEIAGNITNKWLRENAEKHGVIFEEGKYYE